MMEAHARPLPAGSLLQERLREKKATRLSDRRRSVEFHDHQDDRGTQSSPVRNSSAHTFGETGKRPSSSGRGAHDKPMGKKGMGVKEMEEAVSTLHKQNFDLKLELFHRRQRQVALEERLEAMETEQAEMQSVNEKLLSELEKREQAVEEAVGIICSLEDKIEELLQEREIVNAFDSNYKLGREEHPTPSLGTTFTEPKSSPPPSELVTPAQDRGRASSRLTGIMRVPSFLSECSDATGTLRSLCRPGDLGGSDSVVSLPRLLTSPQKRRLDHSSMNSPRLSVLSESSFLSVYGPQELVMPRLNLDDSSATIPGLSEQSRSTSVEKWLDERSIPSTLPSQAVAVKAGRVHKNDFLSLDNVLESPLQRFGKGNSSIFMHGDKAGRLPHLAKKTLIHAEDTYLRSLREKRNQVKTLRSTDLATVEDQPVLPPTPDTFSTGLLRRQQSSNDTLNADVSDIDTKQASKAEQTQIPFQQINSIRPHSAGETITSRRDGHGWDTVSQSEATEVVSTSDVETLSTFDPRNATLRQPRKFFPPPNMFSFDTEEDYWGQDMMFDHNGQHDVSEFRHFDSEPRSDDTVMAAEQAVKNDDEVMAFPVEQTTAPSPPQRGSSLGKPSNSDNRTRGQNPKPPRTSHQSTMIPQASQQTTPISSKDGRKSQFSTKLFQLGRGETLSSPGPAPQRYDHHVHATDPGTKEDVGDKMSYREYLARTQGLKMHPINETRNKHNTGATPPPISRYMRRGSSNVVRPRSAGHTKSWAGKRKSLQAPEGQACVEDIFGFGGDGATDVLDKGREQNTAQTKGPKKWFSLKRAGSVKK